MKRDKELIRESPSGDVTIREVARRAGVSLSSVSRVLNDHPDVSRKLQQRVLKASQDLGYEPHFIAQSLRRGITHTLGFLVGDISNPVFAHIIRGAEDFARSRGYAVMLTNSEADARLDVEHLRLFLRRRVDGIFLATVEDASLEFERELSRPVVPYVVLDRDIPKQSRVSTVLGDHATGMREATLHLLKRGHRDIGFISGSQHLRPVRERLQGFRSAFEREYLEPREDLIRLGSMRPEFGRAEAARMLSQDRPPTALIAGANRLLAGVLDAIHSAGLTVGQDLALVSTDDVELARYYRPPISVVVRDMYRMGQVAAEVLLDRIADPDGPVRSVTLPTSFIARPSSDFPSPTPARRRAIDKGLKAGVR